MSPSLLLDRLADFARRVCQVYGVLEEQSDFPAAVRCFWTCMAEDERRHARVIEAVPAFSTDQALHHQAAALWATCERQRHAYSQTPAPS